jgi:hypothetical protein
VSGPAVLSGLGGVAATAGAVGVALAAPGIAVPVGPVVVVTAVATAALVATGREWFAGAGLLGAAGVVAAATATGEPDLPTTAVAVVLLVAAVELVMRSLDHRRPCRTAPAVERVGLRRVAACSLAGLVAVLVADAVPDDGPVLLVAPALLAAAAVGWSAVVAVRPGRRHVPVPLAVLAAAALVAVAMAGAGAVGGLDGEAERQQAEPAVVVPADEGSQPATAAADDDQRGSVFDELLVRALFLLAMVIVALLVGASLLRPEGGLDPDPLAGDDDPRLGITTGGRADTGVADEPEAEEVVAALGGALDDLQSVTDPGRAVRLAYAHVVAGFGDEAAARRPAESEAEYLQRMFAPLGSANESLRRLTDLFLQARYSELSVDERMRREAIELTAAVRDTVVANRPRPLAAAPGSGTAGTTAGTAGTPGTGPS